MRKKEFCFYLIKLSWKHFFMKEFKWKIFHESQFRRFCDENMMCLVFKFVVNKTNFILTLAPLESKASTLFGDAVSLKLVVVTYMGGAMEKTF